MRGSLAARSDRLRAMTPWQIVRVHSARAGKTRGMAAEEKLAAYRRKRDFSRTPEPSGDQARREEDERRFVVQRHRARNLHYDFRLEIDGVLVSWAVPRGLTLDAKARRAAFHVEDHPMEYFDFEGVIP